MDPRRILVIAEGQLGDLLLLTPALRSVKETYAAADVSVLILERYAATGWVVQSLTSLPRDSHDRLRCILSTNPYLSDIILVNRRALRTLRGIARVGAELSLLRLIRRRRFDAVICTFPEDRFTLWAFASGAKVRVGQKNQSFPFLLSHTPDIGKDRAGVLQYYCDLVRDIGCQVRSLRTEYTVPDESKAWADAYLESTGLSREQRIVAVHPGATGDYKIWPPERYAELIDYLQQSLDVRVMLFKGSQDEPVLEAIRRTLKTMPIQVDTGSNVGHFAALLQRCSLCISNDSGPRHLAVALRVPSVAFFRQHHDREWRIYLESPVSVTVQGRQPCPVCPPGACLDKIPPGERFGSYCIRMIDLDDALTCVRTLLH